MWDISLKQGFHFVFHFMSYLNNALGNGRSFPNDKSGTLSQPLCVQLSTGNNN